MTMLTVSFFVQAADVSKTFTPSPGIVAVIEIKDSNLTWKLSGKNGARQGEVSLDTEKTSSIEIGSYDFSGRLGFLVLHIDDGMGTYEVYRVFTFSPSSNEFVERFPSCGDEFDNLKVDKKRRYLTSTYWDRNIPKRCVTRLTIEK
ncbi:hypothetical protein [Paraburkholderia sacchari]|uniref:hypothetical protein n=1 Tax=Paraburkholderia sacchari TaxID=159450 RepID=UPI001BCAE656|nr:hypothetical protein [Paraburkholderia sacchari]